MAPLQPLNALPSLKDSYATVKDEQAFKRKSLSVRRSGCMEVACLRLKYIGD